MNLMCADSDFDFYFLCFDSVWIALMIEIIHGLYDFSCTYYSLFT